MLNFKCYCCEKELNQPGALLFSPSEKFEGCSDNEFLFMNSVKTYHICVDCFEDIMGYINFK